MAFPFSPRIAQALELATNPTGGGHFCYYGRDSSLEWFQAIPNGKFWVTEAYLAFFTYVI
ncbi:unnamed protein product [marine sediment metagenome]|uniref:Uncharacterized protein n=1 Tax=marine sediment metagenome TaxID=412755 RepID=X1CTF5_9ZZZZ